jgi:hypothetical protein
LRSSCGVFCVDVVLGLGVVVVVVVVVVVDVVVEVLDDEVVIGLTIAWVKVGFFTIGCS